MWNVSFGGTFLLKSVFGFSVWAPKVPYLGCAKSHFMHFLHNLRNFMWSQEWVLKAWAHNTIIVFMHNFILLFVCFCMIFAKTRVVSQVLQKSSYFFLHDFCKKQEWILKGTNQISILRCIWTATATGSKFLHSHYHLHHHHHHRRHHHHHYRHHCPRLWEGQRHIDRGISITVFIIVFWVNIYFWNYWPIHTQHHLKCVKLVHS